MPSCANRLCGSHGSRRTHTGGCDKSTTPGTRTWLAGVSCLPVSQQYHTNNIQRGGLKKPPAANPSHPAVADDMQVHQHRVLKPPQNRNWAAASWRVSSPALALLGFRAGFSRRSPLQGHACMQQQAPCAHPHTTPYQAARPAPGLQASADPRHQGCCCLHCTPAARMPAAATASHQQHADAAPDTRAGLTPQCAVLLLYTRWSHAAGGRSRESCVESSMLCGIMLGQ